MTKFLVTGGAGFIGSNICKELVSQGCFVRIVDNLLTGKKSNLDSVIDKIEFVQADMGDTEVAKSVMKDIDVVLHQGALPSVPLSVEDPAPTHRHCVDATFTLLLAISMPITSTIPEEGARSPTIILRVVVFPAPLCPIIPKISPSRIPKSRS